MTVMRVLFATVVLVLVTPSPAIHAQQSSDPRVIDLVKAGKLRAALGLGSPALAMKDPSSGNVRGPALDLARALANKIGVRLETIEYPRPGAVLGDAQKDKWDITFLVIDPARSGQADFSLPYMQSDFTYLVPSGSSKRSVGELDQPGVRIAVARGAASDLQLTKMLKRAELLRLDSISAAIELVRAGKADAYAASRVLLLGLGSKIPGSRVLNDGFADISWAVMAPKGNAAHLAYVNEFISEAKSSGLIQKAIDQYGLKGIRAAGSKD